MPYLTPTIHGVRRQASYMNRVRAVAMAEMLKGSGGGAVAAPPPRALKRCSPSAPRDACADRSAPRHGPLEWGGGGCGEASGEAGGGG
jgi:hypothetical protein